MKKKLEKIINDIIKNNCRKEALEILSLSSQPDVDLFVKYYNEKSSNICCLHLDYLKAKLVKEGKMQSGGCFGMPFTEFHI